MMLSLSFNVGTAPTELYGVSNKSKSINLGNAVTHNGEHTLNVNKWLPAAAEEYKISAHLSDYILVPVPSIITELPNTNGDSASYRELTRFNPEHGRLACDTWVGKPTYVEHDNQIITRAKGVIFDVMMRPIRSHQGNHYKCIKLLGFDRNKDAVLTKAILAGDVNTYSMGMYFKSYTCSICNTRVGPGSKFTCEHTQLKRKTYMRPDGKLAFRRCEYILGFETSAVADPAFCSANSDVILDVNQFRLSGTSHVTNKNHR